MKKRLMVLGVLLVHLLMMVSPYPVFAEEAIRDSQKEESTLEEAAIKDTQEEESTFIDEESYFDDDFSIPVDGDPEKTQNVLQTDNANFRKEMEAKGFVFRTEEEKRAIIAANPEAGIEIGQISDYYLPEQRNPLITSNGSRDSITFQTLDLGDLKGTNKLQTIGNNGTIFQPDDNTTNYLGLQGGCYDGANYYYCFLEKNTGGTHIDSRIVKGTYNASGELDVDVTVKGLRSAMQHVNDMTYNRDTEELVIVCSEDGYHHIIYTISKYDFQSGATVADFDKHYLSCKINALDYNPTRTQYVARVSGAPNKLVILDSDFRIVKIFEHDIVDGENWVPQGLYVDNAYIYTLSYFTDSSSNDNNEIENRLCIFDWDGNLIKAFQFSIDKHVGEGTNQEVNRHIEAEHIFIANRRMLVGFMWRDTVGGQQNRGFSYVDLSPWTYHVQFVPESTSDEIDRYFDDGQYVTDGNNVSAVMFRNVSTPLRKFRVTKTNKEFVGWTAYRVETNQWLYRHPNDKTINNWYVAGSEPSGYIKYVYNDKQAVSKTGAPSGHVIMCAQWKDANHTFTVSFKKRGGSGTLTDQTITYGTSTALKANTFTKSYRIFMGWNAYWSEKNRWYYVSPDGATKGWYKEGYEPTGYRKYVFANKQKIAKTVYEGSHVYMCALWNEFYIQYDANGATIEHNCVQPQFSSSCTSIYQLQFYPNSIVYNNGAATTKQNEYLTLYRQEDNKWYCSDGWYVLVNGNDSAKTKFMNIAGGAIDGSLLYPGDHLIVVAGWTQI